MKLRWFIIAGLLVAGLVCGSLFIRTESGEQKALEETRRGLRQQGFKVALDEFDLSATGESRARADALTNSFGQSGPFRTVGVNNEFLMAVGPDSALVFWKQDKLESPQGIDVWEKLRESSEENQPALDAACAALLSGPFRFNLNTTAGNAMLLPHLAALKNLSEELGQRAMVELHNGHRDAAWTNVLAATRLVTGWEIEPVEISCMVRYSCFNNAYNILWQALQAGGWPDEKLAGLQRELEATDFLGILPDTAAFSRAATAQSFALERRTASRPALEFAQALRFPRVVWNELTSYWQQSHYRRHESFEVEEQSLLFYRDREVELRNAVKSASWSEMRQLSGLTNQPAFASKAPSRTLAMLHSRQMTMAIVRGGQGLTSQAAKAEAQRRLLITAIALERFRGRNGSYPASLAKLVPAFLKNPPIDFMDGQPLRYRRTENGRFVLYSVGLDGIDEGGKMPQPSLPAALAVNPSGAFLGRRMGGANGNLVWPTPATDAEVEAWQAEQQRRLAARKAAQVEQARAAEEQAEAERQAAVSVLLSDAQYKKTTWRGGVGGSREPDFKGKPLSKFLRNPKASGANRLTLDEMLTLKPVTPATNTGLAIFELPISYELVTNLQGQFGELKLLVDSPPDEPALNADLEDFERATNGNCLLVWDTTYERPGQHALQALFLGSDKMDSELEVKGPVLPYLSTNLCQFEVFYAEFDDSGDWLHARLPESNAVFSIEIKTESGDHVKTLTGSTTNGLINLKWDLLDEQGRKCTNEDLDSFFTIKLPDGRSQTLKQSQNKQARPPSGGF